MTSKRVGDIMIPLEKYPHIPYWFTLRQAIAELEKSVLDIGGRKSLPRALLVFDEKYQLLGVVRRRDILAGLEPRFMQKTHIDHEKALFDLSIDPDLANFSFDETELDTIREQSGRQIKEVMQSIETSVEFEDHLTKAIYFMLLKDLTLLPVLKQGQVVGVIRSVDVFHEVASVLL
jgi:CBS-domain-containing membrane protein